VWQSRTCSSLRRGRAAVVGECAEYRRSLDGQRRTAGSPAAEAAVKGEVRARSSPPRLAAILDRNPATLGKTGGCSETWPRETPPNRRSARSGTRHARPRSRRRRRPAWSRWLTTASRGPSAGRAAAGQPRTPPDRTAVATPPLGAPLRPVRRSHPVRWQRGVARQRRRAGHWPGRRRDPVGLPGPPTSTAIAPAGRAAARLIGRPECGPEIPQEAG
jgi:hypothetical protein